MDDSVAGIVVADSFGDFGSVEEVIGVEVKEVCVGALAPTVNITMAQMAHFAISVRIHNSEFRIPNSEF